MAPTLISGLDELYNCPFYWGKIDQKEAEAILKEKPVGSYLVTDAEDENKDHQLELFFVKMPHINYKFNGSGSIGNLPGIFDFIDNIVHSQIESYFVWPNSLKLTLPICDNDE